MNGKKLLFITLIMTALIIVGAGFAFAQDAAGVLKYHDEWSQSKHVSTRMIPDGHVKLPDDAMCLICHDSNGFIQWSKVGFDPEWGDDAKVGPLGPAAAADCSACHSSEAANEAKLRIAGTTPMLRGGFKVEDAGNSAACIICHNSRRGQRNDTAKPVATQHAPHEASSADMLFGQNFYFVTNGETMNHGEVDGLCVACHMSSDYKGGGHSFKASWDACKDCHDDVDPAAVKAKATADRERLKAAIDVAITTATQAAIDAGELKLLNMTEEEVEDKDYTAFTSGKVSDVNSRYFHGMQAYDIKVDGKKFLVYLHKIQNKGQGLIKTKEGQVIAKAGWNLNMIDHDRSHGAHNPTMQQKIVDASVKVLSETDFSKITPLK